MGGRIPGTALEMEMVAEMNPHEELVTVVDERNVVAGAVPRREMRAGGLIHRASYILVFSRAGELFVQKRTMSKDMYPGYYDVATGGVVLAGESYEDSARRELGEELGIAAPLQRHGEFYYQDGLNRVWGCVFSCVHDGPFVFQKEEVESGMFLPRERIIAMSREAPFTPDGLYVLESMAARIFEVR